MWYILALVLLVLFVCKEMDIKTYWIMMIPFFLLCGFISPIIDKIESEKEKHNDESK
ncbi:hypothetical protein [Staphylococcus succinus]|uniref:hypothetical protein n=1 Tax=Staphylococcus succinus TaxID=61015 RepID=UPI0015FA7455|nr:hypothetical protein [Staphylococcus succinus]